MNLDVQILVNKYGQNLVRPTEIINYFEGLGEIEKRTFLKEMTNLIIQSNPKEDDIETAILASGLKQTFTPVIKIRKGIKTNVLNEIISLPESELSKSVLLFLALYKTAYRRKLETEKDRPFKWWYKDLSDESYIDKIRKLSNIKIMVRKIYNFNGQNVGAVISTLVPFPITFIEKDIIEKRLELYAFNDLFPGVGLNLYKEINNDTASLTVIKDVDLLEFTESNISML